MSQDQKPQNFIQKQPSAIKLIKDKDVFDMLSDPLYEPIIVVLREGPLTLDELKIEYNEYFANKLRKAGLKGKELKDAIMNAEKSETTIYRYVKKLEEQGILFQVGRQIIPDKNTTKALYSRTAVIFVPIQKNMRFWQSDEGKQYAEVVSKLLGLYLPECDCSVSCIHEFLMELDDLNDLELQNLIADHSEELDQITRGFGFSQMDKVFDMFGIMLFLLKSPELLEKLKSCFEENK